MKNLIKVLCLFISCIGYTQQCSYLGPDVYLPYNTTSTTLYADLTQCVATPNPNQTTGYEAISIPYTTQTNTGTSLSMYDDAQQGPFNIGFTFSFFGQAYNQFYVGSNGWISFSDEQPITFVSTTIPDNTGIVPRNCIMGPWQDWHPGAGGQIKYQVQGTAPCRKLIVSWIDVPMYSCTSLKGTFHIVIYESSNIIENYIQDKPNCPSWSNGTAVQGLHNENGDVAITTPNRNSTQWTTVNEAYRYNPNGPEALPILTWYKIGDSNPIGTGDILNITPSVEGAYYVCKPTYPEGYTTWNQCNEIPTLSSDTIFIQLNPPTLTIEPTTPEFNLRQETTCYVPNTFTPNGDEFNQTFGPVFVPGFIPYEFSMIIYNRWGEVIWESFEFNSYWDGTYKGNVLSEGVYSWRIAYTLDESAYTEEMYGHVTILK
jgi:gliding motility-associated-like protein